MSFFFSGGKFENSKKGEETKNQTFPPDTDLGSQTYEHLLEKRGAWPARRARRRGPGLTTAGNSAASRSFAPEEPPRPTQIRVRTRIGAAKLLIVENSLLLISYS